MPPLAHRDRDPSQRTGPHLYETSPSGTYLEYKAHAFGARSQSAKTYLSRLFDKYEAENGKGTAFGKSLYFAPDCPV